MPDDSAPQERSDTASIGARLAAARSDRGLSVEDVAAATRIRATLIRAIEDDDFSRSGGAVYARGHLKSIAQVVGADPRELLDDFDRREDKPALATPTATPLPAAERRRDLGRAASRPSTHWATVAVVVLAVVIIAVGVSWTSGGKDDDAAPPVAAPTATTPAVTTSAAAPAQTTAKPPVKTTPPPKGVTVRVAANAGDSWLQVRSSSGTQVFQGTLASGQSQEFKDGRQLNVKFGNAPAVTLTVNGQEIGRPRCTSTVCSLEFSPAGAS